MSPVPVYFSHSYRREDRDVNDHFWRAFCDAGFSFTVDPGSTSLNTTTLELMMARSVGFVAVVTFRPEEEGYQCSPFILYEYGLAVQTNRPRVVLRDKRVPRHYFEAQGTMQVEFDVAVLDRCTGELERRLDEFRNLTSIRSLDRPYRRARVGIVLKTEVDNDDPSAAARRDLVAKSLAASGNKIVDLTVAANDPWAMSQEADDCDFVIVDLDDRQTVGIADFLTGRGTPLLKVARRSAASTLPERLLGSAPLRRAAAAAELVTYWSDTQEFEARVHEKISRATTDRTEFTDFATGHRYFRSLGREAQPVFVSNAGPMNELAEDLAKALYLENIPFFHYRFHNPIGLGQLWTDQLDRMVAASKIFLPLIDDNYWTREYCRREYEAAVHFAEEGQITIVPALLDGHATGPEVPYQGTDLLNRTRAEQVQLVVKNLDDLLAAHADQRNTAMAAGPVVAGQASVDVAIITILEEEYEAVLRLLNRVRPVMGSAALDNQHAWVVGEVDTPQAPVPYTVALAISPRAGTNAAVIATKNTLQAFDPRCILIVGVAGGLEGLNLADVVVADRICAYEYGKIDHGFQPRDELDSPTDAALASAARTLAPRHPNWYSELNQPQESWNLSPQIVVGPVGSGDKVVDDPTDAFFASIMRSRPRLRAVEMEGAGAAAAIQDAREMQRAVSFGMIRGISDLPRGGGSRPGRQAGQSGQTETRDAWKVRASTAAARAAIQLIRLSWPRPPRAGARP